jgi:tetratricopeptide (TPR) repeat protein
VRLYKILKILKEKYYLCNTRFTKNNGKMKHIKYLTCTLILTASLSAFGQGYFETYKAYLDAGDTLKQEEILMLWEKSNPTDPELFISYFKYCLSKFLPDTPPDRKRQTETEDLTKNEVLQKGFDKINEGIKHYPSRWDMRQEKMHALWQMKHWQELTDEIVRAIHYSKENQNRWTLTHNAAMANGEITFLNILQDYQMRLYHIRQDSLLPYMRKIAEEILRIYPAHVATLSNVALTYIVSQNYDQALACLLQAEGFAPKDDAVLTNIAYCYQAKKDAKNAILYYKKVIKYGERRSILSAKQQVKELKKQNKSKK